MVQSEDRAAPQKLADILSDLNECGGESEGKVSVVDLLDAFDGRVFGPLLLVPGLLAVSPVGAVPGVPTALAVLTVLIESQALFGRRHPWIPKTLRERSVSCDKLEGAIEKMRPWAERIDRWIKPRMYELVTGPARYVAATLALLLAVMMVPLELIPFAVFLPGLGLVMLGLAISAKDGALGIVALIFALATIGLAVWWFFLSG